MASAYGSLVSLTHVLNRVQHPTCPASFDKLQIQLLLDKTNSLVDFLEAYSQQISEDLGRKMIHAAYAAEDVIETYIADQILEESLPDAYDELCRNLEKAIQQMDLIVQESMRVNKKNNVKYQLPLHYLPVDSPVVAPNAMVGFDDELTRLMEQLTTGQSSRQIIPIVGMGGIGKTTLATNVYNHPSVKHHFDKKAWVTISQDFTVGKIIRPLLRDLGFEDVVVDRIGNDELGDELHQCLFSRRYLLILDDIWDVKAWDLIHNFCPDNNNKSRILLTSRISDVGRIVGSCSPFNIKLLDFDRSWELFSEVVFGEEACPSELEDCGKEISNNCKGLPLTIVVIGGMLKASGKTRDNWENVAENISSIVGGEDGGHCLKVLSLSYHELPIHLKPCFLYLATYPYDYEIRVSQLIKLWVADGFLRSNVSDVTLEEVALKYLEELRNRNLIIIRKLNPKKEMKRFSIHDLVMDLCMQEAQKERFLYVDSCGEELPETTESHRRVVHHGSDYASMQPKRFSRSYISFNGWNPTYISQLRMLRSCILFTDSSCEYLLSPLVNLRLVKLTRGVNLDWFQKISMLWNLETLIASIPRHYDSDMYTLPTEIWKLRHIKHISFNKDYVTLPNPPTYNTDFVLQNLHTLVKVRILSDKVLDMIPNIKKLSISSWHDNGAELLHGFDNLARCQKLEILHINAILNSIKFPHSLRKLKIQYSNIPWENCGVGLLPNLEVFELERSRIVGREWVTVEGEFQKLKILSLRVDNLESWKVEDCCHFPSLEHLSLYKERDLNGIPETFGESMTLQSIKIVRCSHDTVLSAMQIMDEQQRQGNDDFEVHVDQYLEDYDNEDAAKEELYSMTTDKFHVIAD